MAPWSQVESPNNTEETGPISLRAKGDPQTRDIVRKIQIKTPGVRNVPNPGKRGVKIPGSANSILHRLFSVSFTIKHILHFNYLCVFI